MILGIKVYLINRFIKRLHAMPTTINWVDIKKVHVYIKNNTVCTISCEDEIT